MADVHFDPYKEPRREPSRALPPPVEDVAARQTRQMADMMTRGKVIPTEVVKAFGTPFEAGDLSFRAPTVDELVVLGAESNAGLAPESLMRHLARWAADKGNTIAAFDPDGALVGCLSVNDVRQGVAEVGWHVAAGHRNRGNGLAIVAAGVGALAREGVERLSAATVRNDHNASAYAERVGFARVDKGGGGHVAFEASARDVLEAVARRSPEAAPSP